MEDEIDWDCHALTTLYVPDGWGVDRSKKRDEFPYVVTLPGIIPSFHDRMRWVAENVHHRWSDCSEFHWSQSDGSFDGPITYMFEDRTEAILFKMQFS